MIGKARQHGLDPDQLADLGRVAGRAEWIAVGDFFEEYLQVLDHEQVLDYSELIHRAVLLARTPEVQRRLRSEFRAVFVDEYQDTDPGQTELLRAIAGDGRDLVVVGDPDQSIYTFRGADVRGLLRFPGEFRTTAGEPAAQVALATTRRFGSTLQRVSRNVASRLGLPGALDRETFERFRNPDASGCEFGRGKVEANLYSTAGAELEHIADLLRRAHVTDERAVAARWRCWCGPAGVRSRRCAGRWPRPGSRSTWPATSCRCRASRRSGRCCWRCARSADPESLTAEVARALALSPLGGDGRRPAAPAGRAPCGTGTGRRPPASGCRRVRRAGPRRAGRPDCCSTRTRPPPRPASLPSAPGC